MRVLHIHVGLFLTAMLFTFDAVAAAFPTVADDPALQKCIEKTALKMGWNHVSEVTSLKCHKQNIRKLDGLGSLYNLSSLSLFNNEITTIDSRVFKPMQSLESLNLARNNVTYFELANLDKLAKLYIFSNQLLELKLRGLKALSLVKANANELRLFEYEHLPKLSKIYIFDNELEHVNIHKLPSMEYMDARQNPMPDELYDEMDALAGATILHDGNADDW